MSIVGEAVAGAALSAFFDVLFDKLSSSDLLNIFRQENVDADLKKWKKTLEKISEVLDDAEDKQMTKVSVKTWLGELEDLAYDADDILDEFATEALRRKLNAEEPSTSKIRKFIPACCVGLDPSSIVFDVNMRSKIKVINTRLQNILTDKKDLELIKNTEGRRTRTTSPRPHTTSLVNEGHTYGRDEDKKAIVKLLLESGDAQLSVIPIVGMGGLGKTTLAQLVYDEVSRHFELKAWVCVSEDFDNLRLTKEILHSFTSEPLDNNSTLDSLQVKLKEKLSGKKFLLVLDDVWNENYELWTELCKPFEFGVQGSKIVVTTRNDGVSSIMGTTPPYKLEELSRDACLRVFTHHALEATDFSEHPELEEFGQRIVDRCKGAPLAAKALGGLLRTKHNPYEWENVLNSKIWDIPEDKSSIFSVLKLSYNYLPSHLKRCFAYCSLFPKDDKFREKELVLLWMAEGLVQETKGKKPMEDLGGDYFRDLLNRSFFQQSSYIESHFVMHDLMNDLAMWAAGDLCCRLEDQLGGSKQSKISTKVRHFSYTEHSNDCIQKFDLKFDEDVHLRTFLSLPLYYERGLTNFDDNYCLLPQLRYLRVLSLGGYKICELPSSIGDLKHLRYLNLSYSKITSLPESTGSLYNLQTLLLKGCSCLTKLPENIENLVNLRHLDITNANSILEMPVGIAKLKSLRTLSNFVVGKGKIVDLMNLESLQGTLCISHLENMLDARKVNLKGKKNLDALVMEWNDDLQDAGVATDILHKLRPHGTIKTLSIKGYVGANFPTWLGDPSFSNMVDLSIERCGKCMFLPAFGQLPSLKRLIIYRMDGVRSIGLEFYGEREQPFRCLVKLCFVDMREWQDWNSCNQDFPCLHELSIFKCPKLRGKLPHHLPSLKKLSIDACQHLVVSIPSDSELQEVKIVGCKDVVHGSLKVEKLIIENCEELTSLCEDELRSFVTLKIEIKSCQSLVNIKLKSALRKLTIKDCNALESLQFVMDEGGASSTSSLLMNEEKIKIKSCQSLVNIKLKSTLRTLTIKGCNALESLQFVMDEGGVSSTSLLMNEENLSCIGHNSAYLLEHLKISDCPSLKCLSTIVDLAAMLKFLDIERCPNLTSLGDTLPTTLNLLKIVSCPKLESIVDKLNKDTLLEEFLIICCEKLRCLPRGLHELCHLKEIDICQCNSLISLGDLLPTNLRGLDISCCKKLEALPINMHNLNFLQDLSIQDCPSIISFPEEGFPTNLRSLDIDCCEKLEALPINMHNLNFLQDLSIEDCPTIVSFPEEGFPTNLRDLRISCCKKLEALPINMHNLNFLQDLSIKDCPTIISFPEEGFPTNLRELRLLGANLCEQVFELGLHRLTLLTYLYIASGIMDSFPEEEDGKTMLMLPTSLTTLIFFNFPNLLFLSWKFFQNLSALEEISIGACPKLASLSEKCFPPSLQRLYIYHCPVLKQNCEKDKGIMWSKIANIPSVRIDDVEQQK